MELLWNSIDNDDLRRKVANCSLYSDIKYRRILENQSRMLADETPTLKRTDLAEWLPEQHFDSNDVFWWKTSGTTTGKRLSVAFPKDFHGQQLRKAYTRFFPEFYRKGALHAHLCPVNICALYTDPSGSREERTKADEIFLTPKQPFPDWQAKDFQRIHDDLTSLKPSTIRFDPYYMSVYIDWAMEKGRKPDFSPLLISSYSALGTALRNKIETYFSDKVVNLVGMSECGPLYLDFGSTVSPVDEGLCYEAAEKFVSIDNTIIYEAYVTSIRNPLFPLLRYQTGDLLTIEADNPNVFRFCARASDLVFFENGKVISPDFIQQKLNETGIANMFQVITSTNHIRLMIIADTFYGHPDQDRINRLYLYLKDIFPKAYGISIETTRNVLPEPSGKTLMIKNSIK